MIDLDALLDAHTANLTDDNEIEIQERRLNSDVDRFGQEAFGAQDLALRTCSCGFSIDGFYEYIDHLRRIANLPERRPQVGS